MLKKLVILTLLAATGFISTYSVSSNLPAPVSISMASMVGDPFEVVLFGDSISLNSNDNNNPGPAYKPRLGALFTEAGVNAHFTTIAHGEWSCAQLQSLVIQVPTNTDLIILNCGTNDTFAPMIDSAYNAIINAMLVRAPTAMILPSWIEYSAFRFGGQAFMNAESEVNNAIYRVTLNSAKGPQVFWPPVDFQSIPEVYLDSGGVHPTPPGYEAMSILIYNRIRVKFGLLDLAPTLCGQNGDFRIPHQSYVPCGTVMAR